MNKQRQKEKIVKAIKNSTASEKLSSEDICAIADALIKAGFAEIKSFAEYIGGTIAGHSNYHGDTILSALYCAAEGKEIDYLKPLNITEYGYKEAIKAKQELQAEIARLTEENEKLKEQTKEFDVLYADIKNGQVDMSVRGTTLKAITACFIQAFIQNGGTNFFLYDLQDDDGNKYSVTIQKANGKTPAEMLHESKAEVAELKARLEKAVILPYEDKEDWYYTVKFPARVEDEIFIINKETNSILSAAVNNIVSYDESGKEWIFSIRYDCEGCDKYGECDYFDCSSKNCIWGDMDIPYGDNEYVVGYTGVNLSEYNKTWFTDRSKAEARIAELKGED